MSARGLECADCLVLVGLAVILAACAGSRPTEEIKTQCLDEKMVFVPSGWFTMGEDDGRASNEPQHTVYQDAFCIQKVDVTRQAFIKFLTETGYRALGWSIPYPEGHSDFPATGVMWEDAQAYCQWANLRLPSEAEWEKAARGTDGRRYPWGDEWDTQNANTVESGKGDVLPMGSFPQGASPYNALDMCGNAAEWVSAALYL